MPVTYFANSIYKKYAPVADALQRVPVPVSAAGSQALTTRLNQIIWTPAVSWQVSEVLLHFSTTDSKNYAINKVVGRGILTNLNDSLWFSVAGNMARIVLPQGFYDGNQLAAALQSALNENPVTSTIAPYTVAYDASTGLFTITPASGTIGYTVDFWQGGGSLRNSTAGIVLGLNADAAAGSSITSDTVVPSLTTVYEITGGTSSSAHDVALTEALQMDMDVALGITVGVAAGITADWRVTYQQEN